MDDNPLHESPLYQMILEEGREEERERSRKALRQGIINVVQGHFPELKDLAAQQVAPIKDVALLNHLLLKISSASNVEEVRSWLLNPPKEEQQ